MNPAAMISHMPGYQSFTVTRQSAPTSWTTGKPVYTTTTVTITGVAVPLSGEELERYEEGDRKHDRRKLFTVDRLYTKDDITQKTADSLPIDGVTYEVERVEPWQGLFWVVTLVNRNTAEAP